MASKTITLKLGGKERRLRFDLNSLAEIGERLGITVRLDQLGSDLVQTPLPLSAPRVCLWAALRHDDPGLTIEEVGSWVDMDNAAEVMEGFFALFGTIFSGPQGDGDRKPLDQLLSTLEASAESGSASSG